MGNTIKLNNNTYIANEIYDSQEHIIGKYDGKNLYRKKFVINNPGTSNTNYDNVAALNIDILVHCYGSYINANGKFPFPLYDSADNYGILFINSANYLRGRFTGSKVYATLEYTKTNE